MQSFDNDSHDPSEFSISMTGTSIVSQNPPGMSQSRYLFYGEIENVQYLIPVFRAIAVQKISVMVITERGFKISCEEESKSVQATAFIDFKVFKRYEMRNRERALTLCFRMQDLLNALSILFPKNRAFSGDSSYSGRSGGNDSVSSLLRLKVENTDRLKLQIISGSDESMAYIQTFKPTKLIVFTMSFVNKVVLDATCLVEFWKCVDTFSPRLEIRINNDDPWLEFISESERGRFIYRITAQSCHVEHYECTLPMSNQYEMNSMCRTLKPLLIASKVSLRLNSQGLLNLQFQIDLEIGQNRQGSSSATNSQGTQSSTSSTRCMIEFFVVPLVKNNSE